MKLPAEWALREAMERAETTFPEAHLNKIKRGQTAMYKELIAFARYIEEKTQ